MRTYPLYNIWIYFNVHYEHYLDDLFCLYNYPLISYSEFEEMILILLQRFKQIVTIFVEYWMTFYHYYNQTLELHSL